MEMQQATPTARDLDAVEPLDLHGKDDLHAAGGMFRSVASSSSFSSSVSQGLRSVHSSVADHHDHALFSTEESDVDELRSLPSFGSCSSMRWGSTNSLLRHVPDAKERDRRAKTKDRVVQMHRVEVERRQQELAAKDARQEEKKRIREENAALALRAAAWAPIVAFLSRRDCWPLEEARAQRRQGLAEIYGSYVYIRARRVLREVRARLALPFVHKPTAYALRADRMLSLFPDAHLWYLIDNMTLRYYFPNETMVFGGCGEEDECFVLARGAADVMVNGQCVFTLANPNDVFGSIGMISGEPRTATVAARGEAGTLVWVATRAHFEEYEKTHGASAASADSHRIITELRIANFRSVFQKQLQGAHLRAHFPELLRDVDVNLIERLVAGSVPQIVGAGSSLARPGPMDRTSTAALVLRGRVVVSIKRGFTLLLNVSPEEIVRTSFLTTSVSAKALDAIIAAVRALQASAPPEEPQPTTTSNLSENEAHQPQQLATLQSTATARFTVTKDTVLGEICAPLMINAPFLVFPGTASYFHVEAGPRGADVLALQRSIILQEDLLELDTLRHNIMDLYAQQLRPLSAKQVLRAVLHDVRSVLPVLRHVSSGDLPAMTPVVLRSGDELKSNAERDHAYLLVAGELETAHSAALTPHSNFPSLWPPLAVAYFGDASSLARARTRVDLFRVDRKELAVFVRTQCELVNAAALATLTASLQHRYLALTGRPEPAVRAAMEAAALNAAAAAKAALTSDIFLSNTEEQVRESGGNDAVILNEESFLSELDDDVDAPAKSTTAYRHTDSNLGRPKDRTPHSSSASSFVSSSDFDKCAPQRYPSTSAVVRESVSDFDLLLSMGSMGSTTNDCQQTTKIGSTASSRSVIPTSPIDRSGPGSFVRRPGPTSSRSPQGTIRSPQAPRRSPQPPRQTAQGLDRSPSHNAMKGISQPRSFHRPFSHDGAMSQTSPGSPPVAPPPTSLSSFRRAPPVVGKTAPTTRNAYN